MSQEHEVQASNGGRIQDEVLVPSHRQHVPQRLAVPANLGEGLLARGQRLLIVYSRRGVIHIDDVALDAVRATNGLGNRVSAQPAGPPAGNPQHVAQLVAHGVDLLEDMRVLERVLASGKLAAWA